MTYQDELRRRLEKREAERHERQLDGRARDVLKAAGWNAKEAELRQAASAENWRKGQLKPVIPPEDVDAVIARALAMQADETVRGRRISVREATVKSPSIGPAKRDEIRDWLREVRAKEPDLAFPLGYERTLRVFRVRLSIENFRATYWKKTQPGTNGAAPTAPAKASTKSKAAPKPKPPVVTAAGVEPPPMFTAAPVVFASPDMTHSGSAGVPVTVHRVEAQTPPALSNVLVVERMLGGTMRVTFVDDCEYHEAMQLVWHIGAALMNRRTEGDSAV